MYEKTMGREGRRMRDYEIKRKYNRKWKRLEDRGKRRREVMEDCEEESQKEEGEKY